MMLGGEAVFSNVVPVSLRAVIPTQYVPVSQPTPSDMMTNGSSTTARIVNFTIEVYLVSNPSRMGRKEVEIRVRDTVDPLSILCCTITEEDYFSMRREQRLLVDYTQFPLKLAELLHQCITSGAEGRSGFTATLQPVNSSVGSTHGVGTTSNLYNEEMDLLISEVTSFRQILHLQLRMRPPTEAALRRHLTEVVRRYQDEINSLKMTGHHPDYFDSKNEHRAQSAFNISSRPSMGFCAPASTASGSAGGVIESEMDRLRSRLAYLEEELASKTRAPRVNPASDESDIIKANEIIRRLQDELKGARTRIRATESSLRQIELVGKETQASYDSLRAELVECRASLSQKTRLLSETETERDKLKTEVEDTRKLVTANEKVIQWLHERMAVDPNNASFGATDSFSRRGLRGKDYDPDFKMNDNIFPREYPIPPPSSPSSSSTSPPVF